MGKVIWSDSSTESVWSARLTGLQVMVVWRPLVWRTVNLHTATMGVHRACFLRYACPSHSPSSDRRGVIPPCLTQSPSVRAPTRERYSDFRNDLNLIQVKELRIQVFVIKFTGTTEHKTKQPLSWP